MPVLSFLKSTRKITGLISFAAGSALLVPLLTSSQVVPPAPAARLQPASLAVDLAPDGAPVDLTSTLSNIGGGTLTWRVGSVRDVSAPSAPAVASGPVAIARVYDKANLERATWAAGELIVGVKEPAAAPGVQSAQAAPAAFGSGRFKVKREMIKAKRGTRSANGAKRLAAPLLRPGRKLYVVNVDDKTKTGMQKAIDDLRKDPNVVYAEPNYRLKAINLPDDPDFGLLYGMHNEGQTGGVADADIDAPEAWDTYTGDHNVIVGVIDTGIDYLHPDLVDNMWTNPGEIPANGLDDDGNGYVDDVHGYDFANHDSDPMDDHFHGTHCAGTIAGSGNNGLGVTGVAWKAKLAALKFLDAGGSGTLEAAVEAIAYANAMDIPITSNSWGGGGFSQALKDVIDAGAERGFLFVAAAGNDANDNDQFPSYPATYESENILAVAATDSRDDMASFSSFGATTVDLGAPGVDVYSCFPNGQYQYLSGTSMATPHVSGAAALLKSYNPQLGYVELKAALLAGVDPVPSLNGRVLSNGRLNVSKALSGTSPPWVSMSPRGPGELAAGASQVLTARVDPKGLTAGEHRAIVTIATNDPAQPDRELEVIARVSACRSLAVSPAALDFGGVWKGTSRKLNLTLINTCNDATQLEAVESSQGVFAAAGALPIKIPAFGKASLEVVYTPDDLAADNAVLTLKSNAQDNPVLKVALQGTGVEPPKVVADPSRFELTLDPAGQAVRKLIVRNTGGDVLNVKLSVGKAASAQSKGAGRRIAGTAPAGQAYSTHKGSAKSPNLHPFFKAQAADLKVLYLTTILPDGYTDGLVAGLRGLENVGSVDVVNGGSSTPDLAFLQNYDLVVVSANQPWANAMSLGNTLADYVDNGGGLCLMVAAIAGGGGYSLQGRITLPEYMPIVMKGAGPGGAATEFTSHPITEGVQSIFCAIPTQAAATQGDGIALGRYPNGALVGAVNADKPIVAINVFPQDGAWSGDLILMMGNTLEYLAGGAGWLKLDSRKAVIDPGSSAEFTLSISADRQLAGDHEAALEIAHNDPISANPLRVPVLLHVLPVNRLALSPSKFDFGGVLAGGRASMKVLLSNSGNQATTVSGIAAALPFSAATPVPVIVPAFSKTEVELAFAPKKEALFAGAATFTSDAADHPSLSVSLRGQGLAAPAAVLAPEKVSLSLAYNASPTDVTSTLSNKGRGVLVYNIGSAKDVTPAAPAAAPKPVLAQRVYQAGNYDRPAVPGELLVGLNEGKASLADASALSASGIAVKRQVLRAMAPKGKPSYAPARKLLLVTIADPSRAGVLKAIDALRKDPNVAYAEPNYRIKAVAVPNDPDFGLLYGMHNEGQTGGVADADIDAPEAWDTHTGDHNVIVGVIDTGIDYLHPDLADNMWTNPGEIPANGLDDDGNGYVDDVHGYDFANHDSDPMDDHFHGTHCAGTIAGSGNNGLGVTGVAWKAKLAALKFLDAGGSGTLEAAVEAIAYANAMDIPITSNSWGGGGFSQALKDVIDAGAERGFLFVAAAGNDANDNDQFPSYPATYESENILAVAATDSRDDMASFSSFGATTVDLGAPGVDVYSCFPNGQYQYLSGTSMATPHVSGAAALLKSYNPQLGYVELKAALLAGVDPVPSLNGRVLSNGRLNVSKALNGVSPPWVVIAPRGQGELAPGASQLLTVTVDPKGLTAGEHSAIIPIATNDPKAPIKELKVNAKVSGCRSLTISSDVTPPALDFGAVWTGASKRLALTLVNKCNDFTTVSSIASSLKTFVPSAVPPLRIPPFGMVSVEIAYTPDDLVADKAVITIKSNAQDNPTLKANASGTGVRPPAIAATPANVSLTLDPSEQKTSIVKVTNNGGADLVVALNTLLERKAPSATAPKLAVAARKTGAPYARAGSARADLRPKTAHPMVRASASGLKVLHLSTLFYPDSAEDQFSSAIRSLPQVALLDRVDGSNSVPNADYLLGYDVVLVSADYAWADPIATGDALAEYVDRGGRVCLLVASIALGGGFEMQGRIGTPDYLPLVKEVGGSYGFANAFADHPITLGLTSLDCGMPTAASQTQGAGISLGQYDNGALIGAVNAVLPVVAINVFPADGFWGGDLILMMSNTLDFLAGNGNWVKVEPANLVVPAGMTLEATLTFDTEKLDAGAYAGALELRHNAPAGANPLAIPLALTVTAKNCLETAVSTVDFGKVWTDRRGMATVTLANPCNRPTRVTSLALSPKVFKTTATAPFDVPAFSEVSVELSYVPDDLTPDNGSLVVKSDAKDHPTLTLLLKGTGIKPPSISVKPASLSLTLDPGAKAAKTLDVYNAGGDSLRVLVKAKSLDEAAKSLGAAQLKPGRPATLRPQIGAPLASRSHASARGFRPLAGGSLKVLFLHGIYMPSEGNDFVMGLRELANVASVDLVDLSMFTPNAAYLADYDVVLVGTDYPAADPVATGDALADYVDAGGKVILCAASFYASEPWALGGRIMDPAYQPILPEYTYYGGASVSLADHPINKGVAGIYSGNVIGTSGVQGAGQPLGTYETGFLTGAFNPEKPVVSLNFYPIEGYWGGDILLLMGNTFDFLANSIRWMKPAVSEFSVGPGKTFKLSVAITAEEMAAGKYQGLLSFQHNAPQGPAPLDVPVALQVRSKRCLTLNPMSMDFGAVWKGGFGQQELSLVNACNEPTTVTAFRAADAAFPAPDSTPLVVGPYSTVRVNVTFAPKDAKLHQSRLDVLSNAAGASTLSVTLKGQGILPPTISVNPASLKESANAGEIKKRVIAVSNKGGDTLDVELRTQAAAEGKAVGQASAPALAKGIGAAVAPYVPGGAVSSFRRLASLPKAKAAGHRILYFTTIIPDSGFGDGFISGLRSLPDVAVLDVKSGAFVTPNADFFLGYDQVVVAANYPFADPVALGDALAEYVDRGGRLCLMSAAISNLKGVGLQGRIASPEYLPMTQEGKGKGGPVSSFEDHPINAGIQFLWSLAPTSSTQVQGDGRPLGFLQNGILLGAWNSTKPVVALNVMPADGAWGGDLIPMMGNIFNHLAKGGGWLSVEPRSLRVAPGGSVEAVVSFDGTKIRAGAHNGSVDLAHNVPGKPPVSVPAAFTVGGRLGLEASAKALDFGPVLIGNSVSDTVSLANTGNLPVTVTAALTGNPAFSLSFNPFPLVLEPGEAVAVNAVFTPVANGSAPAQLSFATEGLAPVVVALNGVGQRPASLAVASSPSPLKFSVPVGGQASGQLSLSDLGDEALRYGMKLQLGAGTGAVKAAADPAQAYGPEHYTLLAKGANDLRVGHPAALSAGGPDGYGYRWFDSKAAGGAAYAWIDISAGGRRLDKVSACDDCSEPADLSFAFPFYGESHKGVNVGSNGYLTFGPVGDAFSNHPLPSKVMPTRLVAALFQDLYPAGGGSIYFQDFGDKAVVQYQAVPDFRGTGVYDFQIVLFPDGTIDLQYQRLTGVKNTATVGIQNGAGDDGLTVAYNADYLKNKLAVRIRTWLGVPQQSGNLPGLGSKTLNLSVDSRSLPVGAHKGTLSVSGGGVQSTRTVDMPVELIVKPK